MLKQLKLLSDELNSSNSTLDKKEVLKKYSGCKELLYYVYNPYIQFYVTSTNLKKRSDLVASDSPEDIFIVLDKLNSREITGHDAISMVNHFIEKNKEYSEIIYNIIDRDLKTRVGAKIINDVFPNLIPEFSVALANKYQDYEDKIDFEREEWYASHKLDGCRCLCVIDKEGNPSFYSREGKSFDTLDVLGKAVKSLGLTNRVLDGEICIIDENGNENFQAIMKEIRRKNHIIKNPKYLLFDILTLEEFDSKKSKATLMERYDRLYNIKINNNFIEILSQKKVDSKNHLVEMVNVANEKNWEGLILRKNSGYEGKRSKNLLKVKKMEDAEYQIIDVKIGFIDDGQGNKVEGVSNITIQHKGNNVDVGSGFTFQERVYWKDHPEELIGKVATIQYFEETTNQKGEHSLRFPVFKFLYGKKRDF